MKKLSFLAILFLLSGCSSTTQLVVGAERVEIITEKPQTHCKRLGEVEGYKYNVGPNLSLKEMQNSAKNDLKNNAFALGADIVEIVSTDSIKASMTDKAREYHIQGIAYKCK